MVLEGTLGTRRVAIKQVHGILRDYARVTQEAPEATLEAFRREYLTTVAPGCIMYMPKECLGDSPRFTAQSDTFSFGVVMLQVSTQEPPSSRMGVDINTACSNDLSKLSDDHPLKSLIVACLDDDPNKRPDMKEVESELRSINRKVVVQKLKSELSKDETVSLISFLLVSSCVDLSSLNPPVVNFGAPPTTTGLTGFCA